jgi:hypothetical protein
LTPVSTGWRQVRFADAIHQAIARAPRPRKVTAVLGGVVAACRFWDIAQGGFGGGEVIAMETDTPEDDAIFNNAFVWCHVYNCGGSGVSMYGAGVHDNYFGFLTLDTRASSIDIEATYTGGGSELISNNHFESIEIGAWMRRQRPLFRQHVQTDHRHAQPAKERLGDTRQSGVPAGRPRRHPNIR